MKVVNNLDSADNHTCQNPLFVLILLKIFVPANWHGLESGRFLVVGVAQHDIFVKGLQINTYYDIYGLCWSSSIPRPSHSILTLCSVIG